MTTNTSPTSPQVLQTYALLQIASEAFLGVNREAAAAVPGATVSPALLGNHKLLTDGNLHTSRMTEQQAKDFAAEWTVVSHQPSPRSPIGTCQT